jgi:Strictosidine synthase
MFDALSAIFMRRGSSLSIPVLDGALKPNNLLEQATVIAECPELEDIAVGADGELYSACGSAIMRVSADGALVPVASFDAKVTAMAFWPDGALAVALGTSVVIDPGTMKNHIIDNVDGKPLSAVNALHADANGSLLICDGSAKRPYPQWSHDLMENGRSGRLLRYDRSSGATTTLCSGLAYAFGACTDAQRRVLVSESWKHQVNVVDKSRSTSVIADLPGYPARMTSTADGGLWLSLFACRTQLIEFVLREADYRRDMMRTIEPEYWVAPALSSGADFLEPLQGGGVKQMGVLKPWAPSRSYGLVIRLDADFAPLFSLHSRAGGRHHGIVAVAQRDDELFVLSKGAGRILRLSIAQIEAAGALP